MTPERIEDFIADSSAGGVATSGSGDGDRCWRTGGFAGLPVAGDLGAGLADVGRAVGTGVRVTPLVGGELWALAKGGWPRSHAIMLIPMYWMAAAATSDATLTAMGQSR